MLLSFIGKKIWHLEYFRILFPTNSYQFTVFSICWFYR